MKEWAEGPIQTSSLRQVRKAKKSWISEALGPPIHSLTCFGQIFERKVFGKNDLPRLKELQADFKIMEKGHKSGKYETTPLDRINNYLKLIKETD